MAEPIADVLEDESSEWIPWRATAFWILTAGVVVLGIGILVLRKAQLGDEPLGSFEFPIVAVVVVMLIGCLYARMQFWLMRTVKYRLSETQLQVQTTYDDGKPFHGYSKTYDLDTLIIAQSVGDALETEKKDEVTFTPRKLLLVFWLEGARVEKQLLLSRSAVKGKSANTLALRQKLATWNQICEAIEARFLPAAQSFRWKRLSPYARYKSLIHQSEIAFLQAPVTAAQMCRASLRAVTDLVGGGTHVLIWAIGWFVATAVLVAGIRAVLPYLGLEHWVSHQEIEPWVLLMFAAGPLAGILVGSVRFFQPMSERVHRDTVREALAEQLVRAKVSKEDLEPILKFAKDDLDGIQAALTRYTIIAALAGACTPLLNQSLESWVSAAMLLVIALIFVLIQLYFNAQMQVLRLTSTVCLIAQSQAQTGPCQEPQV